MCLASRRRRRRIIKPSDNVISSVTHFNQLMFFSKGFVSSAANTVGGNGHERLFIPNGFKDMPPARLIRIFYDDLSFLYFRL